MPSLGLGNSTDTSSIQTFNSHYMAFDGTSDYLSFDDGAGDVIHNLTNFGVDGTAKEFSTSWWMYLTDATTHQFHNLGSYNATVYNYTSNFYIRMGTDMSPANNVDYDYNFAINTWYHCVFTVDDDDGKLYVNGSLEHNESHSSSPELSQARASRIGARHNLGGGSADFTGRCDEFAMYDTILSAADVTALYNNGNPTDLNSKFSYDTDRTANLRLWFRMGDGATDTSSVIYNASTAANKLSLQLTVTNAVITGGHVG